MARPTRSSASSEEWPAGDPALAAFAEDLRVVAGGPAPEPRPGLLAVMRQGPTVPIDSPEATGRKKMLVKTLLGGLAAKVALGAGVAAASMTAAGAAGVLPEPARQAVASVVAAATPFQLPDPSDVTLEVVDDPSGSTSTTSSTTSTTLAGDDDGEAGEDGTPGRTVNHGACVSAAARDARDKAESEPGSHGRTVSSIARSDCGKESTATTSTTSTSTSTTVDDGERTADSRSGGANSGRGNGGNSGNSGNNGNGNSGRGSSGRN